MLHTGPVVNAMGNFEALTFHLPSIAPGKVVKMPESVHWKDKVPNRQSGKVHEEPVHIYHPFGRQADKHRGEAKDTGKEEQR